jgi:hypothetical protein
VVVYSVQPNHSDSDTGSVKITPVTGLSLKFELSERTNQMGLTTTFDIYISLDLYSLKSYKMCILCEQEEGVGSIRNVEAFTYS